MKKVLIGLGILLGIVLMIIGMFVGANNTAINLEEQINESKSSIKIQEKRREDLICNLVDAVESYNKYEQDTIAKIIEARTKANEGQVEEAQVLIAVAEQYPELKSNENYKTLMTELAVTENLIAQHRNNYNIQVKQYNKHIRTFPSSMFLSMIGYKQIDSDYLDYNTSEDAPKNLFKD